MKITSSAVSGLPLWKVIPFFTRIVHSVAFVFGVIDSASTKASWPLLWNSMSELNSCGERARSGIVT